MNPSQRDHDGQGFGKLLEDFYSVKSIATGLTKATRILLRNGSIYYQTRDGSAHRSYKLTKGKGRPINDQDVDYFNEPCLFDSGPVSWANAQFVKFNKTVIKTPSLPLRYKYKLAHHLEKQVFFITSRCDQPVFAGPLYCADVSNSVTEVLATLGYNFNIKDIAIDQYTGDIYLLKYDGEIECFKKKSHYAEVGTLIGKYLNGGFGVPFRHHVKEEESVPLNANNADDEDVICIE